MPFLCDENYQSCRSRDPEETLSLISPTAYLAPRSVLQSNTHNARQSQTNLTATFISIVNGDVDDGGGPSVEAKNFIRQLNGLVALQITQLS